MRTNYIDMIELTQLIALTENPHWILTVPAVQMSLTPFLANKTADSEKTSLINLNTNWINSYSPKNLPVLKGETSWRTMALPGLCHVPSMSPSCLLLTALSSSQVQQRPLASASLCPCKPWGKVLIQLISILLLRKFPHMQSVITTKLLALWGLFFPNKTTGWRTIFLSL